MLRAAQDFSGARSCGKDWDKAAMHRVSHAASGFSSSLSAKRETAGFFLPHEIADGRGRDVAESAGVLGVDRRAEITGAKPIVSHLQPR